MPTNVTMPQLGESVVEGTVAKWLVREGDRVREDQALLEVTTDKIDTEIPSPADGVIGRILVPEGQTVGIGTVLCEIVAATEGTATAAPASAPPRAGAATAAASAAPAAPSTGKPQGIGAERIPQRAAAQVPQEPSREEASSPRSVTRAAPRAAPAPPTAKEATPRQPASVAQQAPREESYIPRSARERAGVSLDDQRVRAAAEKRRSLPAGGDGDGSGAAPSTVERPRVTPVVRRMAADHGVDLSAIRGTGVGGRVTKQDLLQHLESSGVEVDEGVKEGAEVADYGDLLGVEGEPVKAAPARPGRAAGAPGDGPEGPSGAAAERRLLARTDGAPAGPSVLSRPPEQQVGLPQLKDYTPPVVESGEGDQVEPFSKRRKIIAEHMVYSKAVSPHVYTMAEVDMSRVAALREAKKRSFRESEGVNLTFLHFVIVATVRALREFPRVNAVVGQDELILRRDVNIGVAVDTEQGLIVPVIKQADRLSLRGVAREVEELSSKARDRKLRVEDVQGGTFTVSNPGRAGNLIGFAIINQPQLGILRMGEIKKRPVVVELEGTDAIVIRPIMLLSLSYDHRVIDGVTGNSFLYRVREILEQAEFEI
jgi:pyruvate/2-oxoglutarate dehydrogenase complex dihydrolipoamide acyltransferase (E2) component